MLNSTRRCMAWINIHRTCCSSSCSGCYISNYPPRFWWINLIGWLLKSHVPFSSQIFAIIIIWFTSTGKKNNITAIINLFTSLIPSFLASPSISLLAIAFTNSNIVSPTTNKGATIFSIFKRPYISLVTSSPKGHPV